MNKILLSRKGVLSFLLIACGASFSWGQNGISKANFLPYTPVTGSSYPATNPNYFYGALASNSLPTPMTIESFQIINSSYTYSVGLPLSLEVYLRRQDNLSPQQRHSDILYYEGSNNNSGLQTRYPYFPKMEDNFLFRFVGMGTDNLFENRTDQTNFNTIERVDLIVRNGLVLSNPAALGFALFERGNPTNHDGVVVGIITSIDGNGNPLTYATNFINVTSAHYYQSGNIYSSPSPFHVTKREANTNSNLIWNTALTGQGIGGVFMNFSHFNIPANTTIYGYSLFAPDFYTTTTAANRAASAVNWNNATYFPKNTGTNGDIGGIDLSMVAGIVKQLHVSGNVYYDTNGLSDSLLNGTAIYNPSSTPLYVYAINTVTNTIWNKVAVQNNGSFELTKVSLDRMNLVLSSNGNGTEGQQWLQSLKTLPVGWSYVGENFGLQNGYGLGNDFVGYYDGEVFADLKEENITNIRFAIQQKPTATTKTFNVPNGAFSSWSSSPIQGFPSVPSFRFIPMNSAALTGYTYNGSLSGVDPEDCAMPNMCQAGAKFAIETINSNTRLYYDFGVANGGVQLLNANTVISNFDPNKLVIYGSIGTGTSSSPVGFQYALIDAAGVRSDRAPYTLITADPLPLNLVTFSAIKKDDHVAITWTTQQEKEVKSMELLHSSDGANWNTIFTSEPKNESGINIYKFLHHQPILGNNFYKLAINNLLEPTQFSKIELVQYGGAEQVLVYPNPVSDVLTFKANEAAPLEYQYYITDHLGRRQPINGCVKSGDPINVKELANGAYIIYFVEKTNNTKWQIPFSKR